MTTSTLRPDQALVVDRFLAWLSARGDASAGGWVHIVLPPRTGKTVIAAHIASRTGLHAAFVVPTKVLIDQTRAELRRHAPGISIGAHFGELKITVSSGINLTTYASLQQHRRRWSPHLASAALVFVDEAHHALTPGRRRALDQAFPASAVRVALTATPDYGDKRRLADVFPQEIARMELREAMERGLVAPARVHVAEIDVDGSQVELVADDYRPDHLARLLSEGPFLQAALAFRYRADLRDVPCMMACVTRQQAEDLVAYLTRHRPVGRPAPGLVVGETLADERSRVLAAFEAGAIDTIVQVGVLIEGWTSARCKLLIDLAPGRSRVRATQKYFRALTRDGDRVAELVVLLPRDLGRPPVLPMELLLDPGDTWTHGRTIGATGRAPTPVESGTSPIRGVRLIQRLLVCAPLGLPTLDGRRLDEVREVLATSRDFDAKGVPGRMALERMYFQHPAFSGTGAMLLRWLNVSWAAGAYDVWLGGLYPEEVADRLLGEVAEDSGVDFVVWDEESAEEARAEGMVEDLDLEADLLWREAALRAIAAVGTLKPRTALMMRAWTGLDGDGVGYTELGDQFDLSRERCRQVLRDAVHGCRRALYEQEASVQEARGRDALWLDLLALGSVRMSDLPYIARLRGHLARGDPLSALAAVRAHLAVHPDDPFGHAVAAEVLVTAGRRDEAVQHLHRLQGLNSEEPCWKSLADALAAHGHHLDLFRMLDASRVWPWRPVHALMCAGEDAAALAYLEASSDAIDPGSRYHRLLLLFRSQQVDSGAILSALGRDVQIARRLLGERDPHDCPYVMATGGLWASSAGALDRLRAWFNAPLVRAWLDELAVSTEPIAVWKRGAEVGRRTAEALGQG